MSQLFVILQASRELVYKGEVRVGPVKLLLGSGLQVQFPTYKIIDSTLAKDYAASKVSADTCILTANSSRSAVTFYAALKVVIRL